MKNMDDLDFYEDQVKFQERLGAIQQERSKLERQFYSLVRSDKKLQNLRATKLRSYWKHVCERERKARERNETLLRDFSDFENRINSMKLESDKLERLKKAYEEEIIKVYPKWRHEVDVIRAQRQLEEGGYKFSNVSAQPKTSTPLSKTRLNQFDPPRVHEHHREKNISHQPKNITVGSNSKSSRLSAYNTTRRVSDERISIDGRQSSPVDNVPKSPTSKSSVVDGESFTIRPLSKSHSEREDLPSSSLHPFQQIDSPVSSISTEELPPAQPDKNTHQTPTPMSSTHHLTGLPSEVHRVKINKSDPKLISFLNDDLSSSNVSDESSISVGSISMNSKKQENGYNPVESIIDVKSRDYENEKRALPSSPPLRSSSKVVAPIQIPRHSIESLPSDSLTTETSHKTAPLNSTTTYQKLLKSNEFSTMVGIDDNFDEDDKEQDEIESILSPKSTTRRNSIEEPRSFSEPRSQSNVASATAATKNKQSGKDLSSSELLEYPGFFVSKKPKAMWDTDSDEDVGIDTPRFSKDGKSAGKESDRDSEFDFYD